MKPGDLVKPSTPGNDLAVYKYNTGNLLARRAGKLGPGTGEWFPPFMYAKPSDVGIVCDTYGSEACVMFPHGTGWVIDNYVVPIDETSFTL